MSEHIDVPTNVVLIYSRAGQTHVFSSKGVKGLVHVGHHDRRAAFDSVIPTLNEHVKSAYGCEAMYRCDTSYEDFSYHVDSEADLSANAIRFTLDHSASDCH